VKKEKQQLNNLTIQICKYGRLKWGGPHYKTWPKKCATHEQEKETHLDVLAGSRYCIRIRA
jgi:hypothetical protein